MENGLGSESATRLRKKQEIHDFMTPQNPQNGDIAAKGKPDEKSIQRWLKEPFFLMQPPKSTGRDQFGLSDLQRRLKDLSTLSEEDLMATLTGFTSAIVAQDLNLLFLNLLLLVLRLLLHQQMILC